MRLFESHGGRVDVERLGAFTDLTILASRSPAETRYRGAVVQLGPGELLGHRRWFESRWGWSSGKVRRLFSWLESEGLITLENRKTTRPAGSEANRRVTIVRVNDFKGLRLIETVERTAGETGGEETGVESLSHISSLSTYIDSTSSSCSKSLSSNPPLGPPPEKPSKTKVSRRKVQPVADWDLRYAEIESKFPALRTPIARFVSVLAGLNKTGSVSTQRVVVGLLEPMEKSIESGATQVRAWEYAFTQALTKDNFRRGGKPERWVIAVAKSWDPGVDIDASRKNDQRPARKLTFAEQCEAVNRGENPWSD